MKLLVFGHKGWIGQQFINLLNKSEINFVTTNTRADNLKGISEDLYNYTPTHVVSFIGRTHGEGYSTIDYLEQKDKLVENIRDNLYSPFLLAELCRKQNIHYTYLGTGCIFKYDGDHKFTEYDEPNFFGSSYSVVKGFTDRMMNNFDNVLNVRIRMPIVSEYHSRNFITKITSYDKICSIPNSMTVLDELLPYLLKLMEFEAKGTINLCNPGTISHNEILDMYRELVDPSFEYENFTQEEQLKILKADRSNNELDTTRLTTLFPEIKHIKDAVRDCLKVYKIPKNILVTGGCGFIGSNFINNYFPTMKFNKMVNLDAMYYCASLENINEDIRKNNRFTMVEGKCQDEKLVKQLLKRHHITHVIHFAAQSHVTNSFEESLKYTNDNILGTHVLLESCRQYGKIKKFVHISTDEVYGDKMEEKQKEQNIFCPTNPYAATKAGAELIVQSYYHSFGMPIVITRGNNVYGPNQYPEKVIPRFIELLRENKKIQIEGDGQQVRGFLHVDDACSAFSLILEKGEKGEIYNIGSEEEYTILELAEKLISLLGKSRDSIEFVEDRPYNDKRYHINNDKLKELGWNPLVEFDEGLRKLIY